MKEKKRILFTVLEAGAGHKMPALAIRDAIESLYPGRFNMDVVDFFKESGALTDDFLMKRVWDFALAHPIAARMVYALIEFFHFSPRFYIKILLVEAWKKGICYIKEYNPDMIISTQFYCLPASSMSRDFLKLPIKVIGYVTDPFCGYSLWADRGADYILVSSEKARQMIIRRKVSPERVKIFPFPVNQKFFSRARTGEQIIRRYSLNPDYKTVLATAGGQGISNIGIFVKKIYKKGLPLNVIAVCGKNEKLRLELEALKSGTSSITNLIPIGYADNMNELLSVSDLNIAKAGASTTFEALFMDNPIIFTHYAAPPEKPNIDYCIENKVGWYTPGEKSFFKVLNMILNKGILEEYKNNLKKLKLHSGSEEIAKFIVSQL